MLKPEIEYRKQDFDQEHSQPLLLSDGQTWFLPKPWLRVNPVFRNGKPVGHWNCFTCGPELDELVEAIGKAEGMVETVMAAMALGATLLLRNYDLTDDELAKVLVFDAGDKQSLEMLRRIVDVATGQTGPKHLPAGAA